MQHKMATSRSRELRRFTPEQMLASFLESAKKFANLDKSEVKALRPLVEMAAREEIDGKTLEEWWREGLLDPRFSETHEGQTTAEQMSPLGLALSYMLNNMERSYKPEREGMPRHLRKAFLAPDGPIMASPPKIQKAEDKQSMAKQRRSTQDRFLAKATKAVRPDLYRLYNYLRKSVGLRPAPDDAEWFTDDDYGYMFVYVPKGDNRKVGVQVSLSDAQAYEGPGYVGANVKIEAGYDDGEIIDDFIPFNYTRDVWTKDIDELKSRVDMLYQVSDELPAAEREFNA